MFPGAQGLLAACLWWEIIPWLACLNADSSGQSHPSLAQGAGTRQAFLWAVLSAALPYLLVYLAVLGAPSQPPQLVMVESSPSESDVAQTARPGVATNDV